MNHSLFIRQLRYWTLHCTLNALPSFAIALLYLNLWKSPAAILAMVLAIGCFILIYATVTSLQGPLADRKHIFSQALALGTKVRAGISMVSLFALASEEALIFMPDFWCGFMASAIIGQFSRFGATDFLSVFATTMLEGFILSFILLLISFLAVILLQARRRLKTPSMPSTETTSHTDSAR